MLVRWLADPQGYEPERFWTRPSGGSQLRTPL